MNKFIRSSQGKGLMVALKVIKCSARRSDAYGDSPRARDVVRPSDRRKRSDK